MSEGMKWRNKQKEACHYTLQQPTKELYLQLAVGSVIIEATQTMREFKCQQWQNSHS